MAAAATKGNLSDITNLVDVSNSRKYLVDSGGSAFNIIPHRSSSHATGLHLVTADGSPIL